MLMGRSRKEKMMKILGKTYLLLIILMTTGTVIIAQDVENDFEYRTSIKLSLKPLKKLKINFVPEARFKDDFDVDRYMLETELIYKPLKFLYLSGGYRFVINPRTEKETEYLHRYEFSATVKKDFERFEPSFRIRYTNYADDDADDNFLRYRAALSYNIKNCKLRPTLSAELFHQLSTNESYKMRYKLALDYKLFKKNYISAAYRFDYYLQEEKNKHIFSLGYKIKF